jgi:hypothetical protein
MSLFLVTLLTGIGLLAFGGHFLWHGPRTETAAKAFPRSKPAAYLLMGLASAWFLYEVTQLGPADFGQYKHLFFILFLAVALGSFHFVPDFLAVRGLAGLILLTAGFILNAGYMHYEAAALILKVFVYLMILVALVLGASPYKLRDFLDWLYRSARRPRVFGGCFAAYGIVLTIAAFAHV